MPGDALLFLFFFLVLQNVLDIFVFVGLVASCGYECLIRCHTSCEHTPTCVNKFSYVYLFACSLVYQARPSLTERWSSLIDYLQPYTINFKCTFKYLPKIERLCALIR